jgi:membrane protein
MCVVAERVRIGITVEDRSLSCFADLRDLVKSASRVRARTPHACIPATPALRITRVRAAARLVPVMVQHLQMQACVLVHTESGGHAMAAKEAARQGWGVLKETFMEFSKDECSRKAAALSYYTVFSLPPLLVIIIISVGLALSPEQVAHWIQGQVGNLIGGDSAREILRMVERAQAKVEGGFSVSLLLGIVGLLFGATGTFAELQSSLNAAWEVQPDPKQNEVKNFLVKRIFSLGMILVIAFLLLVALIVSSVISALSDYFGGMLPGGVSTAVLWLANAGISLAVITFLFASIFKVLPDAKVAWRDVGVGAFATAVLFVLGKFLITLYIGQSNPGEVFGAAAALALLLVWIYYSSMILFLGAEFTQVWARRYGKGIEPETGAMRVIREKREIRAPQPPETPAPPQGREPRESPEPRKLHEPAHQAR